MTARRTNDEWSAIWRNENSYMKTLWLNYPAQKLRNIIRYQGYGYSSAEFYWNAMATKNIKHYKDKDKTNEKWRLHERKRSKFVYRRYKDAFDDDDEITGEEDASKKDQDQEQEQEQKHKKLKPLDEDAPDKIPLLHEIEYPYYEIDKELTGDKQRFHDHFRNQPKNVTRFMAPYSQKFYSHVANPALSHTLTSPQFSSSMSKPRACHPSSTKKKLMGQISKSSDTPYADTFSSNNGMDLHITYSQSQLVHKSVPYRIRQGYFKPAVNNIIVQMQLIEIGRKSTHQLNEYLRLAHEKNMNSMVRYSTYHVNAAINRHSRHSRQTTLPFPDLHTVLEFPSIMLYNADTHFLDLNHNLPYSDEIFFINDTLTLIKRKKFAVRSLLRNPSSPRCKYCNNTSTCPECMKCIQCDFHYFECRHILNLQLLKKEKNQPLALSELAGVACRRQVTVQGEKAYPNQTDIRNSSLGQCPSYHNNDITFHPTPSKMINFIEYFSFESESEWPELLSRFRMETNIEKIELKERLHHISTQRRNALLFETSCPNQDSSNVHIEERCSYLNIPLNTRIFATRWNTDHSKDKNEGMFLTHSRRHGGRNADLVPKWIHSHLPVSGYYHTEQIFQRLERKSRSEFENLMTSERWYSLFNMHHGFTGSTELTQLQNGDWVRMTPPFMSTIPPPSPRGRKVARIPSTGVSSNNGSSGSTINIVNIANIPNIANILDFDGDYDNYDANSQPRRPYDVSPQPRRPYVSSPLPPLQISHPPTDDVSSELSDSVFSAENIGDMD